MPCHNAQHGAREGRTLDQRTSTSFGGQDGCTHSESKEISQQHRLSTYHWKTVTMFLCMPRCSMPRHRIPVAFRHAVKHPQPPPPWRKL